MKKSYKFPLFITACLVAGVLIGYGQKNHAGAGDVCFAGIERVKIDDAFWSPKLQLWSTVTANDVLDKFEGLHLGDPQERDANNALLNFDAVAKGESGTGRHAGPPWYDGLVYETIRGVADLLVFSPDKKLEERIDGYIERIYAAQRSDPDGYINTYTQLVEPDHRWGDKGGFLRWQHDVYNAGALIEAGVHYYKATGKTRLLEVSVRFANHMTDLMGPAPKRNIVPSHSGPEEAMMKLYWLFRDHPKLKSEMGIPVDEDEYYKLTRFWIENRGNNCGYPLWLEWGNGGSEQWIKDEKYMEYSFGEHTRPSWGDYAQDSISVFEQQTIEGHAVRATLLATGMAAVALENRSHEYTETVSRLWDNMAGRRMFVTGGVGAIYHDEKFGPDYFLTTDAYLETCAAVGAGFFSQRMNELTTEAKYMDEFERVLYNNILTGISLSGNRYTYQNPLNSHSHERWEWHPCPCCPPMFLKLVSALPGFIYSYGSDNLYVNLFIGSSTDITMADGISVGLAQQTGYPWKGDIVLQVEPEKEQKFAINIRIPGWAREVENPYGLYSSDLQSSVSLSVNGKPQKLNIVDGYARISRKWKKGDRIMLSLPVQPRIITADENVESLRDMISIASGPVVYCIEEADNPDLDGLKLDKLSAFEATYAEDILGGVNFIKGIGSGQVEFIAVPYYAVGNRQPGGYKVWLPVK